MASDILYIFELRILKPRIGIYGLRVSFKRVEHNK